MTWSNLRFNVSRSFVTMATNLPSCFFIQFLEQLLKFLVNFTLLKYVESQRSYGFLVTKELIFGFQILDKRSLLSLLNKYWKCHATLLKCEKILTFSPDLKNDDSDGLSEWLI